MSKENFFNGSNCITVVDGKFESYFTTGYSRLGWDGEHIDRNSLEFWPEGSCFDKRPTLECELSSIIKDDPQKFMELYKTLKNDPVSFPIAERVRRKYKTELESILND